jgi:hypothetical protein
MRWQEDHKEEDGRNEYARPSDEPIDGLKNLRELVEGVDRRHRRGSRPWDTGLFWVANGRLSSENVPAACEEGGHGP